MTKREFIVSQLKEYILDPSKCGYFNGYCVNITPDGKMCVVGKNLLEEVRKEHPNEGVLSIYMNQGEEMFIPESRNQLHPVEWMEMQRLHDNIAEGVECSGETLSVLGFASFEELKEECVK